MCRPLRHKQKHEQHNPPLGPCRETTETRSKPSPETTPSTPSCKTSVCSDTAAGDNSAESHSEECGGLSECIQEADVQEAGEGHGGDTLNKKLEDLF